MGFSRVSERILRGDVVNAWACREPLADVGLGCREQRPGQGIKHERANHDAFLHQLAHRHGRRAIAICGVDRDARIDRHQLQRGGEIAAEIDLDDTIDTAACGEAERLLGHVLAFVVDDKIGAGGPRLRRLGVRTHGGDDARAAPFCQLHRVVTDRAGASGDQHRLVRDGAVGEHGAPRGHAGNAERRALCKAEIIGQRCHQLLRQRDIFRSGPEGAAIALAVEQPDALARFEPSHALADLVDDPGAIAVGDYAWVVHRPVAAATATDVGGIDAGRLQPDPDLARSGLRRRHLAVTQDLARGARALVPDRLHLQRAREGAAIEQDVLAGDETGLCPAQEGAGEPELLRIAEAVRTD